ncbi:unnamed protein product [Moneuplotes crassus]|uniref:Uncharacterized protein n=1 Tax=Euplotes crassus TaxID=5936 RepID=A0AAD1UHY5_EUPCR|nr:unnamed protein product [Moneuplotes crassus]
MCWGFITSYQKKKHQEHLSYIVTAKDFQDEASYLNLCNFNNKIQGNKIALFSESCNTLISKNYMSVNHKAQSPGLGLGGNVNNQTFADYFRPSIANQFANGVQTMDPIIAALPIPQVGPTAINFSKDELRTLCKKQQEQENLIESLSSMVTRIVTENETKDTKIHKLESDIGYLSKLLADYKSVVNKKVEDFISMHNKSHNGNLMSQDRNPQKLEKAFESSETHSRTGEICLSNITESKESDSKISDCIEISTVSYGNEYADKEKISKNKPSVALYNPNQIAPSDGYYCSMKPVNSMTPSEVEAIEGCNKELKNAIQNCSKDQSSLILDQESSTIDFFKQNPSSTLFSPQKESQQTENLDDYNLTSTPRKQKRRKKSKKYTKKDPGPKKSSVNNSKAGLGIKRRKSKENFKLDGTPRDENSSSNVVCLD